MEYTRFDTHCVIRYAILLCKMMIIKNEGGGGGGAPKSFMLFKQNVSLKIQQNILHLRECVVGSTDINKKIQCMRAWSPAIFRRQQERSVYITLILTQTTDIDLPQYTLCYDLKYEPLIR